MEGVCGCPTEAVGCDGDRYDWLTTPIIDWHTISKRYGNPPVEFEISAPIVPYAETLAEEKSDSFIVPSRASFWQRIVAYLIGRHPML